MGTGDNGRYTKKDRGAVRARKHQHRHAPSVAAAAPFRVDPSKANPVRTPNAGRKRSLLLVRKLMPRAGMIYFGSRYLLIREHRDRALGVAMRKAFGFVTKPLLNERFAHMFEAATEVQQQQLRQWDDSSPQSHAAFDSDIFFKSLRQHPFVQPWAQHLSQSLLTSLFMNLRACRLNWHRAPQSPLDISEHSLVAKAIDAFNAADILSWSTDAPFLGWMIRGGAGFYTKKAIIMANNAMDVEYPQEKRTAMDVDVSSGNGGGFDDGTSANLASSIPAGDAMEGIITHADIIFQLTYDQVVESMRLLSIEVDVPSLVEAFARHSLDDGRVQAAKWHETQADFADDWDVEMVL